MGEQMNNITYVYVGIYKTPKKQDSRIPTDMTRFLIPNNIHLLYV